MGKLVLVTVPIGNPDDITLRALEALKSGQNFAVEDTRSFKALLDHYGIIYGEKWIDSFHDHSDEGKVEKLMKIIGEKGTLYLCSEAGSPIISDPALPLVRKAIELGFELDSYGGISSVISGLELSGLNTLPFSFHGFLPRDHKGQEEFAQKMQRFGGTHLFFESPHRVEATLDFLTEILSDEKFFVGRELTKKFQSRHYFFGSQWSEIKKEVNFKGEFVIAVECAEKQNVYESDLVKLAEQILEEGARSKTIAKMLGIILQKNTKDIYSKLVE